MNKIEDIPILKGIPVQIRIVLNFGSNINFNPISIGKQLKFRFA